MLVAVAIAAVYTFGLDTVFAKIVDLVLNVHHLIGATRV